MNVQITEEQRRQSRREVQLQKSLSRRNKSYLENLEKRNEVNAIRAEERAEADFFPDDLPDITRLSRGTAGENTDETGDLHAASASNSKPSKAGADDDEHEEVPRAGSLSSVEDYNSRRLSLSRKSSLGAAASNPLAQLRSLPPEERERRELELREMYARKGIPFPDVETLLVSVAAGAAVAEDVKHFSIDEEDEDLLDEAAEEQHPEDEIDASPLNDAPPGAAGAGAMCSDPLGESSASSAVCSTATGSSNASLFGSSVGSTAGADLAEAASSASSSQSSSKQNTKPEPQAAESSATTSPEAAAGNKSSSPRSCSSSALRGTDGGPAEVKQQGRRGRGQVGGTAMGDLPPPRPLHLDALKSAGAGGRSKQGQSAKQNIAASTTGAGGGGATPADESNFASPASCKTAGSYQTAGSSTQVSPVANKTQPRVQSPLPNIEEDPWWNNNK